MRKYILFLSVLVGLYRCVYASDTNGITQVADNSVIDHDRQALSLLMASASDSLSGGPGGLAGAVVSNTISTNKPAWEGSAALGLTATAGNSDSALVTGDVRAHRKSAVDDWTLGADAAYGEIKSVKNNESLHGYAQYDHLFTPRWYAYGHVDALHDAVADVTYRFTASPGVGFYFIKEKETTLSLEAGPAILSEKLDDEYHTYPVLRFAQHFEHKFDGHARLWESVEILPPVTRPREFLANAEIGVETPITKVLSLQTYVQDNYANRPAPGFKDNDVKVVSALAIKF